MTDPDKTELARDRTALAEDRTILAHERSFAGWVRTGMASVGIGLGFNALFGKLEPGWVPKAIASLFLAIAIFVFLSAMKRACLALDRLDAHRVAEVKPVRIRLLSWSLVAATVALVAAMWLLAPG